MTTKTKLFFLQDLLMGNTTVYSGHSGTGKKFDMVQGDYGKYAMRPTTYEKCQELIKTIEKDAKGLYEFKWNIVPITKIDLCNFYTTEQSNEFKKLRDEQKLIES